MRTLVLFMLAVATVFLAGSLLSYPVFLVLSAGSGIQFDKVIHFSVLLTGIGCGLYYLRMSSQCAVLGFNVPRRLATRYFFTGFAGGVVLLIVIESCLFILGMRRIDPDLYNGLTSLSLVVAKALLSGIFTGIAEEILFRGAIFTALARYSGNFHALAVSSLFYAAVHFIDIPPLPAGSDINWYTGIAVLAVSLDKFSDPGIWDSFLTLFALGVLFSMIRWKTGNISQCTGLHAGIVTTNKIFSYATDYREGGPHAALVNTFDHVTGHLATAWLIIACVFYYFTCYGKTVKRESTDK